MRLLPALFSIVFLFMATLTSADAAALLSVQPTGAGSYTINGSGLDGVAGIKLTIAYDYPALQHPVVSYGTLVAGAFTVDNTTVPGEIRLATVSSTPISGSGQIAAISFYSPTGTGSITAVTANLIDVNGAPLPVTVNLTKPGDCDSNGSVTIAEVQSAINMFLGLNGVQACVDTDRSNAVSIAEVQKVINGFLGL